MSVRSHALRSSEWLADQLGNPRVKILDGSFHLPTIWRDPCEEFLDRHIPGARFFDIDEIRDPQSPLPHMLPPPQDFAEAMTALGVANDDSVVVYDAPGSTAAARAWWMLRVFGHADVAILDGGLERWVAEGRAVVSGPPPVARRPTVYTAAAPDLSRVRTAAQVMANLMSGAELVVDNRGADRFAGTAPEPRPVRRLGHIPGSVNLPFPLFLDADRHGAWRSDAEIAAVFAAAEANDGRPLVGYCGSGVTACCTAFAAYLIGRDNVSVYDGSWAEWGNMDDVPVER